MPPSHEIKPRTAEVAGSNPARSTKFFKRILYCELNDTDPKGILRDAGSKAFRDRFADFVRRLEREPPDMIEDMRRAYRECEPFLCIVCAQVVSFKMLSSRLHY